MGSLTGESEVRCFLAGEIDAERRAEVEPLELGGVASPILLLGCCCCSGSESSCSEEEEEQSEESEMSIKMTLLFLLPSSPSRCCSTLGRGNPNSGEGEGGNLSFLAPPTLFVLSFCTALLTTGAGVASRLARGTVRSRKKEGSRRLRSADEDGGGFGGEEVGLEGDEEKEVGLRGEEERRKVGARLGREREVGRGRARGGGGMEERRGEEEGYREGISACALKKENKSITHLRIYHHHPRPDRGASCHSSSSQSSTL